MFYRSVPHLAFLLLLMLMLGAWGKAATPRDVTLVVDGKAVVARTGQVRVSGLLAEVGVPVGRWDMVVPPLDAPLPSDTSVVVRHAVPVTIIADGQQTRVYTLASSSAEALRENGIAVSSLDLVAVHGPAGAVSRAQVSADKSAQPGRFTALASADPNPLSAELGPDATIKVHRARRVYLHQGDLEETVHTTQERVGDLLAHHQIPLFPEDLVSPSPDTPVAEGLHVHIQRSKPVTLIADGPSRQLRTRAGSVGELLAQQGITVGHIDRLSPGVASPIKDGITVELVRVKEEIRVLEESIPFREEQRPNLELELDNYRVVQNGRPGLLRRSIRIVYEDGVEVKRTKEREWVEEEPVNTITEYGTKIAVRTLNTSQGAVSYWRKVRLYATWYTAATSGKTRGDPTYGITRSGLRATHGIVAVDPTVIPLFTNLYVPGYGVAVAADTGGAIKGRIIDLAYDEGEPHTWGSKWVDVYFLAPAPPAESIRWVLPD